MRTTVTLDPDTAKLIRDLMREHGISFNQALNDAIRSGLVPGKKNGARRFTQKTYPLGAEQYFRWDRALVVAESIEDEELSRKLRCTPTRSPAGKGHLRN
jgi:hypothetical protein